MSAAVLQCDHQATVGLYPLTFSPALLKLVCTGLETMLCLQVTAMRCNETLAVVRSSQLPRVEYHCAGKVRLASSWMLWLPWRQAVQRRKLRLALRSVQTRLTSGLCETIRLWQLYLEAHLSCGGASRVLGMCAG